MFRMPGGRRSNDGRRCWKCGYFRCRCYEIKAKKKAKMKAKSDKATPEGSTRPCRRCGKLFETPAPEILCPACVNLSIQKLAEMMEVKMDKIEFLQKIGNEICEDCGPDTDCGITPSDCSRIENASALLDEYLSNKQEGAI